MTEGDASSLSGASRPRLPRGVRLKHDDIRNEWLLLAPERVLKTNAIAVEILKRCTGEKSLDAIVDDLASTFTAERSRVDNDVRALLTELATKRLVDL
ncbi:MAG: pyrroloquinoline quinone biosynthesis peptide chaperone PqqD [Hyphomicrobiales bacterium]|nr:pyrroloquinoline quinone biosynthesis peptide chaperone PqqD [Hyphomicrobiales bacterium]MBV9052155.1 pyrroloquinoline quinone biosynthesis peptide chaperone PqqD [Hyphomicrobiales bacterium]MBV9590604.1 pyrroloquinoline quinone biosynthesis peptide chaperone PqqD [Hyphomicrobiales bacterium]MBV9976437.1 pyrroloquinoline quinone biosynthesis peptide chaperone PqqD [Hyphomicrobiales bacterium]